MTTPRDDGGVTRTSSSETGDAKRDWRAPTLTVLGEATALTQQQSLTTFDGGLGSS